MMYWRTLERGKDFIHFHDDPDGLWADAKLSKGSIRMSVSTVTAQTELMEKIAKKLDSLNSPREGSRKRR
jgi:hypothetical protein